MEKNLIFDITSISKPELLITETNYEQNFAPLIVGVAGSKNSN